MALGPKMCLFFNLSYLVVFLSILYLTYLNVKNGGIYPGDFPEGEGSELLEFYSSHPLHGISKCLEGPMMTLSIYQKITDHLFCLLAHWLTDCLFVFRFLSHTVNILINFVSIIVFLLYVHLTIDPEFRKEPTKIHLLNFSNILFIIPVMLYAQEWLTAERTSVRAQ